MKVVRNARRGLSVRGRQRHDATGPPRPSDDTDAREATPDRRADSSAQWLLPTAAIVQAATITLVAGVVGLVNDVASDGLSAFRHSSTLLDACTAALGVALWVIAHRHTRRRWFTPSLPLVAFAIVALNDAIGSTAPAVVGAWIVIVFVWVGLWLPRLAQYLLVPPAVAAYVIPLFAGAPRTPSDLPALAVLMPMALLVGNVVSAQSARLRRTVHDQHELLGEMGRANLTDPLTGVGNRRLGDILVDTLAVDDAIVMLDIDHFKDVNDRLGHAAGDDVLRQFGEHLTRNLRRNDGAARMGGEEFMLVVRGLRGRSVEVAERVVSGWRDLAPAATVSAGVAVRRRGEAATVTYDRADAALYRAKESGRDRVVAESR